MEKYARLFLKHLTKIMEFIIAVLLACGIIIMIVQLIFSIGELPDLNTYPNYDDLLTSCFNLIIGVELIRMLYLHTPITVFEVLLFAIAVTCGSPQEAYSPTGANGHTVQEYLNSFESSFRHVRADFKGFYVFYGAAPADGSKPNATELAASARNYVDFLYSLTGKAPAAVHQAVQQPGK